MNPTAIRTLLLIKDAPADAMDICDKLGITKRQLERIAKDLSDLEYVKSNGKISLKLNAKTGLLKKVARRFDLIRLLRDSNEDVVVRLTAPKTIDELVRETGLSQVTIYRALDDLRSIGAAVETNGKFVLNEHKDLQLFVNILNTERERTQVEPYAEVLYSDSSKILKRIPAGKTAEGELTAFSLFTNYGIQYYPVYDYYIQQDEPTSLEDILIHSIVAADKENDKTALIMAVVFYLRNRDRMALDRIRRIARSFKIHELWLDVEAYIRKMPVKHREKFLPWDEFKQKAELYELTEYELPPPYPELFRDLGATLEKLVEAYLFGGENMRIKGLKNVTKDCDIVTRDERSFKLIKETLTKMGYRPLAREKLSEEDKRINPSAILVHPRRSRVDLFALQVVNKLYLSEGMRKRAELQEFGKLKLGIMCNEDVFLLKSVTDREGDIQDMIRLVQAGDFRWEVVLEELEWQEKESGKLFGIDLLASLDLLKERANIESPFYRKLLGRTLENAIVSLVLKGKGTVKEITDLIDFPEYTIRNKINKLLRERRIRKEVRRDGTILLKPKQSQR